MPIGSGDTDGAMLMAYALALDAAELEAWEALRAAGAGPIVLKGRSIAELLYPEGTRLSSDIDLLIDPRRERAAAGALAALGYERHKLGPSPRLSGGEMWVSSPRQPPIDLHISLPFTGADPVEAFEALAGRAAPIRLEGGSVSVLDSAGVALHVALHALLEGPRNERTLEDLRRACLQLRRETWSEATELAQLLGAPDGLAAGLSLLPEGRSLAADLGLPGSGGSLVAQLAAEGLPNLAPGVITLARQRGGLARLRTLGRLLVPSPARQRDRWVVARRGWLGLAASYVVWPLYLAAMAPRLALALVRSWLRTRRSSQA